MSFIHRLDRARPRSAAEESRARGRQAVAALAVWALTVAALACREVDVVADDGDGSSSNAASSQLASSAASTSASASTGAGGGAAGAYTALNMVTGAPRMALLKRDDVRDLCFQLQLVASAGSVVDLGDSMGNVEVARVTNDADDCTPWEPSWPPPPQGAVVEVTKLAGTLVITEPPCEVSIDAIMSFADDVAWTPDVEALKVSDLPIEGGCP